jgi:succinate dehydrogenase / fumarate reductase membrane anchor subunit
MAQKTNKLLTTPLKRMRGLGASHSGAEHWLSVRLVALALLPLSFWFVYGVVSHIDAGHAELVDWIGHPVNTVLLVLTLLFTFNHAASGMQEVYEDYIPAKLPRLMVIALTRGVALLLSVASAVAVLKIAVAG